jgi:MHS family proline/betaine transporter-like MFS transporter
MASTSINTSSSVNNSSNRPLTHNNHRHNSCDYAHRGTNIHKSRMIAILGTIIEWAEYTFFAYMADQLSSHFFPIEDPNVALLKTYGIFGSSYLMRPLGAFLFGTIGDRYGRKPALMLSMLLMGIATMAIGLLPSYQSIGSYAPLMLILCRLTQGLAVSGEFHGAITYLHEHAKAKPFFDGSFAPFAAATGMSLGALAAWLCSISQNPDAWRIPFLCSALLCLLAIYLRLKLKETPAFQEAKQNHALSHNPVLLVLKENKMGMLRTASMGLFISIFVYTGNIFFKIVSIKLGGLQPLDAARIVTFGQVLAALAILFFGRLADLWGGRKMCLFGLALALSGGPFILYCAESGDIALTFAGQVVYALINGLVSAPMMTLLMNQFQTQNRYSGTALGWSFAASIFGSTALLVAEWLLQITGSILAPGFYISLTAGIAFMLMRDRKQAVSVSSMSPMMATRHLST